MPSTTLQNFGYPESLIKSYQHWHLLLRPMQPSIGSLVLVCKESVQKYSDISSAAMTEKSVVIQDIEEILGHRFNYSKINYLMLMMVDPAVHFHVIPRYEQAVEFCDQSYIDKSWPTPPDLSHDIKLGDVYQQELLKTLRNDFSVYQINRDEESRINSKKKFVRMYTSGCFDIFHQGHLNILKKTKELCDYLIVGVSTDEVIIKSKGRPPLIPFEERISILEANKYVDEVIPQINKDKQAIVDQYSINAISVGSDWRGKYPEVTCEMVYFDYTPNVSSTVLKQSLNLDIDNNS
ncbi:MAG: adenylyltransferase/cytidyltransferase family protein [Kangiellaceae bacterium]|nr:adenylyltransferase/cytidyltransferase family protein [Kangiellaceae bacterium]